MLLSTDADQISQTQNRTRTGGPRSSWHKESRASVADAKLGTGNRVAHDGFETRDSLTSLGPWSCIGAGASGTLGPFLQQHFGFTATALAAGPVRGRRLGRLLVA